MAEIFPIAFHRLPERGNILVIDNADFRIISSPVRHLVPTIGLRLESKREGSTIAYSCDTEPCPEFLRLAMGADVVIHEAAGATIGHSNASQAGAIAKEAGAEKLVLIHYDVHNLDEDALLAAARGTFDGEVVLATDFMELEV